MTSAQHATRRLLVRCRQYLQHLPDCEIAAGPTWVVDAHIPNDPGRAGVCTCDRDACAAALDEALR